MSIPVCIVAARRTPIGAFQGALGTVAATDLGAAAVKAALADSRAPADQVDEVIPGCVLQAGLRQAPARQAALGAGLPKSVPATTVHKVCGSGMNPRCWAAMRFAPARPRWLLRADLSP